MMQNVDCLSFKWNIQQTVCEIKNAANAFLQAPRACFFFLFLTIITAIECYNTYDFMYTFS